MFCFASLYDMRSTASACPLSSSRRVRRVREKSTTTTHERCWSFCGLGPPPPSLPRGLGGRGALRAPPLLAAAAAAVLADATRPRSNHRAVALPRHGRRVRARPDRARRRLRGARARGGRGCLSRRRRRRAVRRWRCDARGLSRRFKPSARAERVSGTTIVPPSRRRSRAALRPSLSRANQRVGRGTTILPPSRRRSPAALRRSLSREVLRVARALDASTVSLYHRSMGFAEVPSDGVSHQDSVPCYPLGRNHRWALRRYLAMTCRIRIRCLVTHSEGITDGLCGGT